MVCPMISRRGFVSNCHLSWGWFLFLGGKNRKSAQRGAYYDVLLVSWTTFRSASLPWGGLHDKPMSGQLECNLCACA